MKTLNTYLKENTLNQGDVVSEFFFIVRNSATLSHYKHLTTNSFAQHSALGSFYEDIIGLLDSFMESYIGRCGKLELINPVSDFLDVYQLRDWVNENRQFLANTSELQNIIDEIVSLCNSTIYKLDNLR